MKETLRQGLAEALQLEREGHQYYASLAQETANPLVRSLFEELAQDELHHLERFEKIYQQVTRDEQPQFETVTGIPLGERLKERFFRLKGSEVRAAEFQKVAALEKAMEMERESVSLYEEREKGASSDEERGFYRSLQKEEYQHLEALENVHLYLTNPGQWFDLEESKRWNWMNT